MRPWTERHAEAGRHVADGRRVIDRQRALIERQTALSSDTQRSKGLLAAFEGSQAIFEGDLARCGESEREEKAPARK